MRKAGANCTIFEGIFANDTLDGYGRKIYESGFYYVGYWKEGQTHRWGKYTDFNGDFLEGDWFEGTYK